jgi:uncharacterized hydrophobic protein (TIGR00271 family)
VSDSTATVIGAMIVAPLMTPILGTVFSVTVGDGVNVARSLGLVVAGAALVVALGVVFGFAVPIEVTSETSTQVAGRVSPRLVDLAAALATGAVGAFALAREDVSDTLPGVAIAISLVPPLAVVGLTLEAGRETEALGAMLLFLTNVGAILLSGIIVMAVFRVHRVAAGGAASDARAPRRARAVVFIVAFVAIIAVPLAGATVQTTDLRRDASTIADVSREWAVASGWEVTALDQLADGFLVRVAGPLPSPPTEELRRDLDAAGLADVDVTVELIPAQRVALPGS